MTAARHWPSLTTLLATTLCACASTSGPPVSKAAAPPAVEGERAVVIRFAARIGDRELRCGERYDGVGSSAATVLLQDFRIYVSGFQLLKADGSGQPLRLTGDDVFVGPEVALLDFEDATGNCNGNAARNMQVSGTVPAADYVGLQFDLGVPAALNHQDPTLAAPPLNFSALTWPWRYGYTHTTIDLDTGRAPDSSAMSGHAASGFSIHLGSVDCGEGSPRTPPETPCTTPNRPTYTLPAFDPATQVVTLDLAALLAGTDVTVNDPDSASGCMSGAEDDDCVALMDRIGLPFRDQPSAGQRWVGVAAATE